MKIIQRNVDYAIRALCVIAKNKKGIYPVSDLVQKLKIPRPFLRKILQQLNQAGLLKSYKGQGGGFRLAVSAEKVSLVDLMEIFQGGFRLSECLFKKKSCPRQRFCALKNRINQIERKVTQLLEKITLESLLE